MKQDAKTFILSKLSELVKVIPELKIIYKLDTYSREHLIKVLPRYEYKMNENYHKFEEDLLFKFIEIYPQENLIFLTDGDWIDIDQHDLEFVGSKFFNSAIRWNFKDTYDPTFSENELFEFPDLNEDFVNMSEILDSFNIVKNAITEPLLINLSTNVFLQHSGRDFCVFNRKVTENSINTFSQPEDEFPCDQSCGCDNYALAA